MKKLYRFHWDCGRHGNIGGLFVEEEEKVAMAIGKNVSLGEALGKHSDIFGPLELDDLTIISEDRHFIEDFERIIGKDFSYNPLAYLSEEDV